MHVLSQAARQDLAVLMAIVQVVQKWLNSTAYQSHNIMNSLFSSLARVIKSRGSTTLPNLIGIVSAVAPTRSVEISGSSAFYLFLFCLS